jgi:hypothetical protein
MQALIHRESEEQIEVALDRFHATVMGWIQSVQAEDILDQLSAIQAKAASPNFDTKAGAALSGATRKHLEDHAAHLHARAEHVRNTGIHHARALHDLGHLIEGTSLPIGKDVTYDPVSGGFTHTGDEGARQKARSEGGSGGGSGGGDGSWMDTPISPANALGDLASAPARFILGIPRHLHERGNAMALDAHTHAAHLHNLAHSLLHPEDGKYIPEMPVASVNAPPPVKKAQKPDVTIEEPTDKDLERAFAQLSAIRRQR